MNEEADDDESNEICDDFMLDGYEASFCLTPKKGLLSKGKYIFIMHFSLIWAGTVKHLVHKAQRIYVYQKWGAVVVQIYTSIIELMGDISSVDFAHFRWNVYW